MDNYLGEVRLMSFMFAPRGWAVCVGQLLPINQNQALFSLLGTTYGGDGRVTFALPDLRGRALMHEGESRPMGERPGQESVTLTLQEIPRHHHDLASGVGQADRTHAQGGFLATASDAYVRGDGANLVALDPKSVASVGSTQPHENRQPYLALNYCIAISGIYPSRN